VGRWAARNGYEAVVELLAQDSVHPVSKDTAQNGKRARGLLHARTTQLQSRHMIGVVPLPTSPLHLSHSIVRSISHRLLSGRFLPCQSCGRRGSFRMRTGLHNPRTFLSREWPDIKLIMLLETTPTQPPLCIRVA
jgi:hypothetical protein